LIEPSRKFLKRAFTKEQGAEIRDERDKRKRLEANNHRQELKKSAGYSAKEVPAEGDTR